MFQRTKDDDDEDPLLRSSSNRFRWSHYVSLLVRCLRRCSFLRNLLLFIVLIYLLMISLRLDQMERFFPSQRFVETTKKKFLLVVAHPDDECLFFGPTVLGFISRGFQGHLIVFSKGNYEGLAHQREKELIRSCEQLGIASERCLSFNRTEFPDDPQQWWPKELLRDLIDTYLLKNDIDLLISFDRDGISGHVNHRSLALALESFPSNRSLSIYRLTSVSALVKYFSFFNLLPTLLDYFFHPSSNRILFLNSPREYLRTVWAFREHRSQQRWFRYFYIFFSRYMFINDLNPISMK